MPAYATPQPESSQHLSSCSRLGSGAHSLLALRLVAAALFAACMLLPGTTVAAQGSPTPAAVPAQKPAAAAPGSHPAGIQPAKQPAPAATPAQPKPPDWPANDQPSEATVVWDSQGLRIVASNSSLAQILKDVSTKTGATLEGMGQDQRIFGAYGPGPARDVLCQLLDGSGYNIVMVGDQGQGTPRRIVLSARPKGSAQPSGNSSPSTSNEEETQAEPQPEPQPAPVRENSPAGMPVRPQPMPPEIPQRQQQQQQQNPQN
jgi:hypothetical protein